MAREDHFSKSSASPKNISKKKKKAKKVKKPVSFTRIPSPQPENIDFLPEEQTKTLNKSKAKEAKEAKRKTKEAIREVLSGSDLSDSDSLTSRTPSPFTHESYRVNEQFMGEYDLNSSPGSPVSNKRPAEKTHEKPVKRSKKELDVKLVSSKYIEKGVSATEDTPRKPGRGAIIEYVPYRSTINLVRKKWKKTGKFEYISDLLQNIMDNFKTMGHGYFSKYDHEQFVLDQKALFEFFLDFEDLLDLQK